MDNTSTFAIEFMSNEWIRNASITIVLSSIYYYYIYNLEKNKITNILKISALVILTMTLSYHIILILNDLWTFKEDLPLHLCSVSALICCLIFFVKKKQYLFEFVFYCGIIGGLMAILTPQITLYDGNYFFYIMFYFKHASIIIIPLLLMYKLKMKLSKYSWLKTFGGINILLAIVMPVNAALGSNYLYVAEPPIAKNPLILGTGENTILGLPDYVFGFEIILLLLLVLFYLIFKPKNKDV
ncbi:MAG: TIGR02206 family membrane protein [Flavobacteriaceae bacterium]|nr:TIGR02206 family membrane protein [Flavobacteriaceae bacterium]